MKHVRHFFSILLILCLLSGLLPMSVLADEYTDPAVLKNAYLQTEQPMQMSLAAQQ